ncbi:Oidioi.mRNA.OKI2018_I69.chr1.g865.t1.cds [Oikopleura dioica]|uniref:Oidioi.mRNA.OKI2018_I69.chr1.g865.t1.cds n=1 Tax=Oikopleura dioica TaxID=34765 RepID=A0ABN7SQG1_OIKDI|nr:Oidioi.mRNA.OKI2018_I69.chr1.g865.t1.cds [Oikopleura dioica]
MKQLNSRQFLCENDLYDSESRVKIFFDEKIDCEQMNLNATFWKENDLWNTDYLGEKWVLINRLKNRTTGSLPNLRRDIGFKTVPLTEVENITGFHFCDRNQNALAISWIPYEQRFTMSSAKKGQTFCIYDK